MQLVTKQTGPAGQKVLRVLIEEGMEIIKELYCSVLVDRTKQSVVLLASTEGGMDIEEVAANTPEKFSKFLPIHHWVCFPIRHQNWLTDLESIKSIPNFSGLLQNFSVPFIKPLSMRIAASSRSIPWFLPATTG